jgi:hypothetical protein
MLRAYEAPAKHWYIHAKSLRNKLNEYQSGKMTRKIMHMNVCAILRAIENKAEYERVWVHYHE